MKLLKKRPIAILIMVAAMVLSAFIGGVRSLAAERSRIEESFYAAVSDAGDSIQGELEWIANTASQFKLIAGRYLDEDDPYLAQLDDQRRQLSDAETAGEKREAVNALYSTVTALYDALDPAVYKMNSIDKSYRTSLYDDISSAMQRIEANAYNAEASEFNALLDDFIPSIIASLAGIQPLELF